MTRLRVARSNLTFHDSVEHRYMEEILDAFINMRLLTAFNSTGTATIEISHEALIQHWPRLKGWCQGARGDHDRQREISSAVDAWFRDGKPKDRLYRGGQLLEAHAWAQRNSPTRRELEFLRTCESASQEEEEKRRKQQIREIALQRQSNRRLRVAFAVLLLLFIVGSVLGSIAGLAWQNALTQARIARSQAIAAEANNYILKNQFDLGLLLSVQAYHMDDNYETRNNLLNALEASAHIARVWRYTGSSTVVNMMFSPDKESFLSLHADGTMRLWNIITGTQRPQGMISSKIIQLMGLPSSDDISARAISAMGPLGATSNYQGVVTLWNLALGQKLVGPPPPKYYYRVNGLAFSRDETLLAINGSHQFPSFYDSEIRIWNIALKKDIVLLRSGKIDGLQSLAFSPNGHMLAAGDAAGSIYLWDVKTGKLLGSPFLGHTAAVKSLAFSPDGTLLASGSDDESVRLWNITTGKPVGDPLLGQGSSITAVAFSADGKYIASNGMNHTIMLWNTTATTSVVSRSLPCALKGYMWPGVPSNPLGPIALRPDGRMIAIGQLSTLLFCDLTTGQVSSKLALEGGDFLKALTFSADGRTVAFADSDGFHLFNVLTGTLIGHPFGAFNSSSYGDYNVTPLKFSPNGKILAVCCEGNAITLWDVATQTILHQLKYSNLTENVDINLNLGSVIFSPDGRFMALGMLDTSGKGSQTVIWNIAEEKGSIVETISGNASEFSPDGKILVIIDTNGGIRLWNVADKSFSELSPDEIGTHTSEKAVFSSDGKTLIIISPDSNSQSGSNITLWNIEKQERLVQPIFVPGSIIGLLAHQGNQFIISSLVVHQTIMEVAAFFWNFDITSWESYACNLAQRNFSPTEWKQFVPGEPYRTVCPNVLTKPST